MTQAFNLGQFANRVNTSGQANLTTAVTGVLPVANGGTGQSTTTAAINALLPSQTGNAGRILQTDGTNLSWQLSATRSGVTNVTLSAGTPNVTLTATDGQLVVIGADATGYSITMPNATTLSPLGVGFYTFLNTSTFPIAIRDSSGVIREFLLGSSQAALKLRSNGTASGLWQFENPIQVGSLPNSVNYTGAFVTANFGNGLLSLFQITATSYLACYTKGSPSTTNLTGWVRPLRFTIATNTWEYGAEVQLAGATNAAGNISYTATTNGNNIVLLAQRRGGWFADQFASTVLHAVGVNSTTNTAFVTTVDTFNGNNPTGGQSGSSPQLSLLFTNSSNAFLFSARYFPESGTTSTPSQLARGVTIAFGGGSNPTFTQSSASLTVNGTSGASSNNGSCFFTSFTSGYLDGMNSANTVTASSFFSYVPATNTFTSGTRTITQRPFLSANMLRLNSNGSKAIIQDDEGNVRVASITGAGTSSASMTIDTTAAFKAFPAPSYGSSSYSFVSNTVPTQFSVSSSQVLFTASATNNPTYIEVDPTTLNFNVNTAALSGPSAFCYFLTATNLLIFSETRYSQVSIASPFKG